MRLAEFELERFFAPREFSARYNLCASDSECWSVGDVLSLDGGEPRAMERIPLSYTPPGGTPDLRTSIAALYGPTITNENVIVQSAGEEAIFTFACGLLGPGDHVIVHYPSYQSLHEIPRALGCDVTLWQADPARSWALDLGTLRDELRPNTRVVIVNFPHNPTGYLMPRTDWDELIDIVRSRGLILFSDEAYRGLEYETADRLPAACDAYERGVSLGVLSKGFGLPGLRIGWVATRDAVVRTAVQRVLDYTTICASAPSQFLADIAIRHSDQLLASARQRVARHLPYLDSFFLRHRNLLEWVRPQAGLVAFPHLAGEASVETFCQQVLEDIGVLLLPGTVFSRPTRHFRIGFGRNETLEALALLDDYLSAS